jgi:hypothetical protein
MGGNPMQNFWWFQAAKNKRRIETIARLENEIDRLEAMANDLRLEPGSRSLAQRKLVQARRIEIEELITEMIG